MEIDNEAQIRGRYWNMKKSRFAKKMMALILAVVTAVTLMPVNGFMSKVSADETENVKPNYLTFTAKEAGSTITFGWKTGSDVMYSTDSGNSWSGYTRGTQIQLDKVGSTVSFKGKNVTTNYDKHFTMKGKIEASGSVTSLTDGEGNKTDVNLSKECYEYMFYECTSLTTAPELPATTLQPYCYAFMFYGCTSLTTAPELPAEQLASICYNSMFSGCTSLTTAPKLPAKQLASFCYEYMFYGCTSLTTAPELPAEQLAESCYEYMLSGCTSLTEAPELKATTLQNACYEYMFSGCTSLTEASELPATTLASFCYASMFSGCTSLTEAPELPATTLASFCYASMFSGCTSLTEAPELPATTLASYCYYYMFDKCTGLKETPDLPATNLAEYCYSYMFNGCTELIEAPNLPAKTLASNCYKLMFYNCTTLRISTKLDEQHSKKWSISSQADTQNMFSGCTKVDFGNGSHEANAGEIYYTGCNHEYNSKNECNKCHWMNVTIIDSVDVTITAPVPGVSFPTSVTCRTTGVSGCSGIKWTKEDGTEVKADDKVQYGATYYANVTLTKKEGYGFSDTVTITCNGKESPNAGCNITGGSLNIKIPFCVKANLISITQPQPVQASYGAEKSAEGLGLPDTVKIKTESSDIISAPVTWDFKNVKYDPNKNDEQKFEVSGEITLPDTVVNKNNIPLNVKVNVTVSAARLAGSVSDIADIGKTYDGTAVSVPEFTTTNAKSDKTVTYEYKPKDAADAEYSEAVPVNAGSYTVRITVAEDDNYSKAVNTKDFTITKKPVNIKWSDNEFTYDGKVHKAQADVISDDIVGKDKVSVITTGEQTNAGKYTATATGVDNANYVLSTEADSTHDFSIARKPIKVTADSVQKHVNADDPKFTYTVEANALVTGDTLKDITVERTKGEECGKYDITITAKANSNPNYEITTVDGKLTIADHIYSDTTYTWSADNTECTAARKCTYCDKTDTETAKSKAEVTQNNSCTLPELTKYTVSFKNENGTAFKAQAKENVQTKEATGHKWDGGVQTKAPTYTDEGEMTYTCESCGATKTESIEKLKLNEYDILEGADTTHVLKVDEAHAIRVNCEVEYFLDVMVDGKTVDPKYYTVKSGSTIVTFTKEFLDSLSVGDHEVKFLFTNGTAKATITVVEKQAQETKPADNDKTDINKPAASQKPAQQTAAPAKKAAINQKKATRTDDDNPAMMVLILMLLGGAGAVGYSLKRRKAR